MRAVLAPCLPTGGIGYGSQKQRREAACNEQVGSSDHRAVGRTGHEFDLPAQEARSSCEMDDGEVIDESEHLIEQEEPMPDDGNETGPAKGP